MRNYNLQFEFQNDGETHKNLSKITIIHKFRRKKLTIENK